MTKHDGDIKWMSLHVYRADDDAHAELSWDIKDGAVVDRRPFRVSSMADAEPTEFEYNKAKKVGLGFINGNDFGRFIEHAKWKAIADDIGETTAVADIAYVRAFGGVYVFSLMAFFTYPFLEEVL